MLCTVVLDRVLRCSAAMSATCRLQNIQVSLKLKFEEQDIVFILIRPRLGGQGACRTNGHKSFALPGFIEHPELDKIIVLDGRVTGRISRFSNDKVCRVTVLFAREQE